MQIKWNKWEWSELYVLIKLIADWELYQADINLNKDEENIYQIIRAYKAENSHELEFSVNKELNTINLIKIGKDWMILDENSFSIDTFKEASIKLLNWINNTKGKSFEIGTIEDFLNSINVSKVKADSWSKADIKVRIYDHRLAKETDLWFSIKSLLGSDSTLFNAGTWNNFIFKFDWWLPIDIQEFNSKTYNAPGKMSKLTFRLKEIENQWYKSTFNWIQSEQLMKNLRMIDWDLPQIIAYWLYFRWIKAEANLLDICNILEKVDPLNFYNWIPSEQRIYEYKIQKFLVECAMWMTSERPWMWEYDRFGGVIIVKNDWELVCFHIYDMNLFRKYLLENTRFEQASTGEDEDNPWHSNIDSWKNFFYGWLYKNWNDLLIKLNLQIRFKK